MNRVALDLGFIKIYWYSITMLLGVVLGGSITYLELKRLKLDKEYFFNMLFYVIIFGFLGARLYYVLFNLDYYLANPTEILAIWNGGLAIHGGIIGGVITILVYSKKHNKKLNEIIKYIDICTFGLILGQIIGRWGNFFNSEAHGGETTRLFLEKIHILLLLVRKNKNLKNGMILAIYLIWYSIVRFFIEALRTDSLMLGTLKMAQVISIILFIVGIIIFIISLKKGNYYNERKN